MPHQQLSVEIERTPLFYNSKLRSFFNYYFHIFFIIYGFILTLPVLPFRGSSVFCSVTEGIVYWNEFTVSMQIYRYATNVNLSITYLLTYSLANLFTEVH